MPWFDIQNIEEIKKFIDPSKMHCYIFGKIKIVQADGKEVWIEGVKFAAFRLPHKARGYNDIMVRLYADNWILPETDLKSHELFNKHFQQMKRILRSEITEYGGYEGIADKRTVS